MRNNVENIAKLPKWYGMTIVLICGILAAEQSTFIYDFIKDSFTEVSSMMDVVFRFSYVINILIVFAMWIIGSLMFHITALLLGGDQELKKILYISAYPMIILIMALSISILLTNKITLNCQPEEVEVFLRGNKYFLMSHYVVNISYVLYFSAIAIVVHYLYNLRWYYAVLSVFLPIGAIYGIIEIISIL